MTGKELTDEDCEKIIELCGWHLGICKLTDCIIDSCDIMKGKCDGNVMEMTENKKRFKIFGSMVEDTMDIIPSTLWQDEKQKQKYCDELNNLHNENKQLKERNERFSKTVAEQIIMIKEYREENEQLKKLNEKSNNKRALLNDELRGLFQGYIIQCRSISEEAIITMIKRDVKKIVFEVFEE